MQERSDELPGSASTVLDLGDPDAGDRLVATATAAFGRLDVLVKAAGIVAFGNLADTPDIVIEELFLTNVIGPLRLLRRCLPLLQASQGTVVQISGVVAEQPLSGMAAHSATKAALSAADAALARELRWVGIRVLDVRPPHTNTGLHERPLHGSAPRLSGGLDPHAMARTIADALDQPKRLQLAAAEFGTNSSDQVTSERHLNIGSIKRGEPHLSRSVNFGTADERIRALRAPPSANPPTNRCTISWHRAEDAGPTMW